MRQEKLGHSTRGDVDQSDRIVSVEDLVDSSSAGVEQPLFAPDLMDPSCFVNSDYIDESGTED